MGKEEERDYENIRRQIEQSCVLTSKPEKCYTGYTLFSTYMGNIFTLSSIVTSIYPADKKDFRFLNSPSLSNSNRRTLSLNHDISRFD
jgi:hypothetical protein